MIPSEPLAFQAPIPPGSLPRVPRLGGPRAVGTPGAVTRRRPKGCVPVRPPRTRGTEDSRAPHVHRWMRPPHETGWASASRGWGCPPAHPTQGSLTSHKPQDDPEGGEGKAAPGP